MDRALFFSKRSLAFTCILTMLISYMVFGSLPALAGHGVYTVNRSNDAPPIGPDHECDTNPAEGNQNHCTLREAILEANNDGVPTVINVGSPALPIPNLITLDLPGTGENQDRTGDLDIRPDDTLQIFGNGVTVIQDQPDRVIEV
ncbi:MAG TPA: hypothetical protein VE174_05285, partial [Actinomycetota bacterium]|nr:hypothetical protein [Actinomycetota bacterium]